MILRDLVYGVLLMSAVLLGSTAFYTTTYLQYGTNDTAMNTTALSYRTIYAINGTVGNMSDSLNQTSSADVAASLLNFNILNGVWNALNLLKVIPGIFGDLMSTTFAMLNSPGINLGVPGWVILIGGAIMIAFLVFEIMSATLRIRI